MAGESGAFPSDFAVIRVAEDGTLDSEFDNDGKVIVAVDGSDHAYALEIDDAGRLWVAGYSSTFMVFSVVRLVADGSLDTSFGLDGRVTVDFDDPLEPRDDSAYGAALDGQGRLIVVGQTKPWLTRIWNEQPPTSG